MIVIATILFLCSLVMLFTEDDRDSKFFYLFVAVIFEVWTLLLVVPMPKEIEDVEYKISIQLLNSKGEVIITDGVEIDTIHIERVPNWIDQHEL